MAAILLQCVPMRLCAQILYVTVWRCSEEEPIEILLLWITGGPKLGTKLCVLVQRPPAVYLQRLLGTGYLALDW